MKTKNIILSSIFLCILFVFGSVHVEAAQIPSLSLYPTTGSSIVQATIIGADPNANVTLFYQSDSTVHSLVIGTTSNIGYLNTTVDSSVNNIATGVAVYVVVNGAASQSVTWPNYTNTGSLSLSQTNLVLASGQNMVVIAAVSTPLSITSNTNSGVATAVTSTNQVSITAVSVGTTKITVCASGIGCGVISVNVASQGVSVPANIYVNQNSATINTGQSLAIGISGSGNYYVSNNNNPGVAVAIVNGSSLTVTGISIGTTNLSLCAFNTAGNSSTCIPLVVTVTNPTSITATDTTKTLSLGTDQVNLSVGATQSITINGSASGMFSVSSNSNPSVVGASVNGNVLTINGLASGGSNISVCEYGGICTNIYAYVPTPGVVSASSAQNTSTISSPTSAITTSTNPTSQTSSSPTPTFTSYLSPGITSQEVLNLQNILIKKGYLNHTATGYYGPLTTDAVVRFQSANKIQPLGVVGPSTRALLNSTSVTSNAQNNYVFKNPLYVGMTSNDITELQKRLTKLNIYSGPITGYFGSLTEAAVKKYQTQHGLTPLGNVGPGTRNSLNNN